MDLRQLRRAPPPFAGDNFKSLRIIRAGGGATPAAVRLALAMLAARFGQFGLVEIPPGLRPARFDSVDGDGSISDGLPVRHGVEVGLSEQRRQAASERAAPSGGLFRF